MLAAVVLQQRRREGDKLAVHVVIRHRQRNVIQIDVLGHRNRPIRAPGLADAIDVGA
jgi:hypothetical protein